MKLSKFHKIDFVFRKYHKVGVASANELIHIQQLNVSLHFYWSLPIVGGPHAEKNKPIRMSKVILL